MGTSPPFGMVVSLRWVLLHVIEETARHTGHIGVMRERIDGMIGDHGLRYAGDS